MRFFFGFPFWHAKLFTHLKSGPKKKQRCAKLPIQIFCKSFCLWHVALHHSLWVTTPAAPPVNVLEKLANQNLSGCTLASWGKNTDTICGTTCVMWKDTLYIYIFSEKPHGFSTSPNWKKKEIASLEVVSCGVTTSSAAVSSPGGAVYTLKLSRMSSHKPHFWFPSTPSSQDITDLHQSQNPKITFQFLYVSAIFPCAFIFSFRIICLFSSRFCSCLASIRSNQDWFTASWNTGRWKPYFAGIHSGFTTVPQGLMVNYEDDECEYLKKLNHFKQLHSEKVWYKKKWQAGRIWGTVNFYSPCSFFFSWEQWDTINFSIGVGWMVPKAFI